jgi:serine-type D-Ala-D-Ala carboxypeptidase/endopeptidase (penicillin-binding protein 4)
MSWNNIVSNDGTAVSALNLDSNELTVLVRPGAAGQAPLVTAPAYFNFRNEAMTGAPGTPNTLALDRAVGGMDLRLYGSIPADAAEWRDRIGIDDPAHYAAWTLSRMLAARGVRVTGTVRTAHRPVAAWDEHSFASPLGLPIMLRPPALASLVPPPLAEDIAIINKGSQNHHAEVLARRLGDLRGSGSRDWANAAVGEVLAGAGIPRAGYDFSDGSGMSTYNRASPRAAVALLRWGAAQPWGAQWRGTFPIGGVDGTLRRRFANSPLQGRIFAKTGTLNATNALSGYLTAASGRELTFSVFANDVPDGGNAVPVIDAALLLIAATM